MLLDERHVALASLCSKEVTRYALNNLCVERGGAVASDGKCLGYVPTDGLAEEDFPAAPGRELGEGESMMVPIEDLKRAASARPKGKRLHPLMGVIRVGVEDIAAVPAVEGAENGREAGKKAELSIFTGGGVVSMTAPEVDVHFPDWRAIMPSAVARGCKMRKARRNQLAQAIRAGRAAAWTAGPSAVALIGAALRAAREHGRTEPRTVKLNPNIVSAVAKVAVTCEEHRQRGRQGPSCITVTVRSATEAVEARTEDGSVFLIMPIMPLSQA